MEVKQMARKKTNKQLSDEGRAQLNTLANDSLKMFNKSNGVEWSFGDNWNADMLPQFETYINKFLFPKLTESLLINTSLGNKFNWLAEETDFIGQISEEYVIKDSIPTSMNLDKNASLMLERKRPQMITKIYGAGELKKQKFTLNNNDERFNWATLSDAIGYAVGVYTKAISDINVEEERTVKSMLIDYANNIIPFEKTKHVNDLQELISQVYKTLLYLQNNNDKYNEASLASNGAVGRYTTVSSLDNLIILTSDDVKSELLNTNIANTYNIGGLDITDHIISFEDLGGAFRLTSDVTVTSEILTRMQAFGDYQTELGEIIPNGTVFTYDIPEITDKVEIKPPNQELFAFILDINSIRYKRYTKGMLKKPFFNGEFDDVTYWLHYYSVKNISPFYNKAVIGSLADGFYTANPIYTDASVIGSGKKTEEELLDYFDIQIGNLKALQIVNFKRELIGIKNYYQIDWNSDSTTELVITYGGVEIEQYLGENEEIPVIQVDVVKNLTYAPNNNIYDFDANDGAPVAKQTLLTYFDCVLIKTVLGQPLPAQTNPELFDIVNYNEINWEQEGLQDLVMSYNGKLIEPFDFPAQIKGNVTPNK